MLSHRLKGKWSLWRRKGFHSTLLVLFAITPHHSPLWYNLHSYYLYHWGERKRALKTPFLAINVKGGESAKGPHHHANFKKFRDKGFNVFSFGIYILKKSFSKISI
jgi:hypothetical protein